MNTKPEMVRQTDSSVWETWHRQLLEERNRITQKHENQTKDLEKPKLGFSIDSIVGEPLPQMTTKPDLIPQEEREPRKRKRTPSPSEIDPFNTSPKPERLHQDRIQLQFPPENRPMPGPANPFTEAMNGMRAFLPQEAAQHQFPLLRPPLPFFMGAQMNQFMAGLPHQGFPGHLTKEAFANPLYPWLLARQRFLPTRFPDDTLSVSFFCLKESHQHGVSRFVLKLATPEMEGELHLRGPEMASFLLSPFRKPKRVRTAFSPSQLLKLESAFDKNHYVVGTERKQLAQTLNLTETQVKVWFQNRRTKHKRVQTDDDDQGCSTRDQERPEATRLQGDSSGSSGKQKSPTSDCSDIDLEESDEEGGEQGDFFTSQFIEQQMLQLHQQQQLFANQHLPPS